MVSLYFGLPGCGKTTVLASMAYQEVKKIARGRSRYAAVYSTVHLSIPGVVYIDHDCIGKYDLSQSLILVDEGTIFADSRDFKSFGKDKISFFLLHRHYKCDIIIFTQQWDGIDRKIRVITDRVYYIYKPWLLGHWRSKWYRIPYGIIIPDKKNAGEKLGEIIQGYCKPDFFTRLFLTKKIWRPRFYKYFDTYEAPPLPHLPPIYRPYEEKYTKSDGNKP